MKSKMGPVKKGKVSASAARRLAEMLKGGKKTMVAPKSAPVVDAEDLADGGADEDQEKE